MFSVSSFMQSAFAATSVATPSVSIPSISLQTDLVSMITGAGPVVKLVMLVLLLFSVISWAIIFLKAYILYKARKETDVFMNQFWENRNLNKLLQISRSLKYSPVAHMFISGYTEITRIKRIQNESDSEGAYTYSPTVKQSLMDNLDRSMKRIAIDQHRRLEKAIGFLATTGNTTPFIGLFGTVWGIMESFRGIGLKGSASLAVVAPGISEALVATAAGLVAAIPAVIAFNFLSGRLESFQSDMDIFTAEFLSLVERQMFKEQISSKNF